METDKGAKQEVASSSYRPPHLPYLQQHGPDRAIIDYASKLGQSIYKQGCEKLTKDEGFPMTSVTTVAFIKAFENRCSIM